MKEKNLNELIQEVSAILARAAEPRTPPAALKAKIMAAIDEAEAAAPASPAPWFNWGWAMAAVFLFALWTPALMRQAPIIGHVGEIQGTVLLDGKEVSASTPLRDGQRLATGPGASAEIHLGDKALVKMKPDSILSAKALAGGYQMDLDAGATINLVKPGTPYALITPSLKAEARGTGFTVKVMDAQRSYVCICAGKINISKGRFQSDMEAEHHKAVFTRFFDNRVETAPGTLIDHSDGEIAQLLTRFYRGG